MNRLFKFVRAVSPIQFLLMVILLPFLTSIAEAILYFVTLFLDIEFYLPLTDILFSLIFIFALLWMWDISTSLKHKRTEAATKYFKISFLILFTCSILNLIVQFDFDFLHIEFIQVENSTIELIYLFGEILGLILFITYIYIAAYVGRVCKDAIDVSLKRNILIDILEKLHPFFLIFVFPFGIPFFKYKLKQQALRDIAYSQYTNKPNPSLSTNTSPVQPQQRNKVTHNLNPYKPQQEQTNTQQNLKNTTVKEPSKPINKEDHSRFMPKPTNDQNTVDKRTLNNTSTNPTDLNHKPKDSDTDSEDHSRFMPK